MKTNKRTTGVKRLLQMIGMFGMNVPAEYSKTSASALTPDDIKEINRIKRDKALQRQLDKGLKEYEIDGIRVIALNKKNALRKVNKIKASNN